MKNYLLPLLILLCFLFIGCEYLPIEPDNPITDKYTVTFKVEGEGTFTVNNMEGINSLEVEEGTKINLSSTAADGYEFKGWIVDEQIKSLNATYSYTVLRNVSITIKFALKEVKDETEVATIFEEVVEKLAVKRNFTEDVVLPTLINNVKITWTSSSSAIKIDGGKASVTRVVNLDTEVKLTANLSYESMKKVKEFDVVVKALPSTSLDPSDPTLLEAANSISILDEYEANISLPKDALNGKVSISWSSNHPAVAINNYVGNVTKQIYEIGDVLVTLTATFTYNDTTLVKDYFVTIPGLKKTTTDSFVDISSIQDKNNDETVSIKGIVVGVTTKAYLVKDGTGYVLVYTGENHECEVGQIISLNGIVSTYGGVKQIKNPNDVKIISITNYTNPTAVEVDSSYLENYVTANGKDLLSTYIKLTGSFSKSGNYYNVTNFGVNNYTLSLTYPTTKITDSIENNTTIEVYGYLVGITGSKYLQFVTVEANRKVDNTNHGGNPTEGTDVIKIYSINDLHGTFESSPTTSGLARISTYIKNNKDDLSLIISAGDMFQGTALSSMTRGRAMVEAMNAIGFDAMTIGNHEFDWGIDKVNKYNDGLSENGEANFPILVSNITDNSTGALASWATPYTVIKKGNYRIGIIGIIGHDQKSDILTSYVSNLTFTDELAAVKKYTKILRTTEKCDIVIVSAHTDTSSINNSLSALSGEYKINAILNGHTHQFYYGDLSYSRDVPLPYVQSSCYGKMLGFISLTVDRKTKEVVDSYANVFNTTTFNVEEDEEVLKIYDDYKEYVDISNEELGISGERIDQQMGGKWAANVIRDAFKSQIGIINTGGIRGSGFPINNGDMIKYGDIFEIMPFENTIVTLELDGTTLLSVISKGGIFLSNNVVVSGATVTVDGEKVVASRIYTVATIDFLFEKTSYPFESNGVNVKRTGLLFREALVNDVKKQIKENNIFYASK